MKIQLPTINHLALTDEQLHIIHQGLLELPAKYAIPIIQAMNSQLAAAQRAKRGTKQP